MDSPWHLHEWNDARSYIIVKWDCKVNGGSMEQCVQRFFEFKKEIGKNYLFDEIWSHVNHELHARFIGADSNQYKCVKERVEEMSLEGVWFDEVYFRGVGGVGDEPGEITLRWGLEYSKEWAIRKLTYGINTDMGDSWAVDTMDDGAMTAIYIATGYDDYIRMIDKMKQWKVRDRLAFSSITAVDGKGSMGRPIIGDLRSESDTPFRGEDEQNSDNLQSGGFIRNEHKGKGSLALLRHKKNAWPVDKFKSKLYQSKVEKLWHSRYEAGVAKNKGDNKRDSYKAPERREDNFLYQMYKEEKDMQKQVQMESERVKTLPSVPDNQHDMKVERVYHPKMVAIRDKLCCADKEYCIHHHLSASWVEHWHSYGVRWLPIGGGEFFNGYYTIGKKDFFVRIDECGPRFGAWKPLTVGLTGVWSNYADWYWTRAHEAGLKDDRFDSDGNTLSLKSKDDSSIDSISCNSMTSICSVCGEENSLIDGSEHSHPFSGGKDRYFTTQEKPRVGDVGVDSGIQDGKNTNTKSNESSSDEEILMTMKRCTKRRVVWSSDEE